MVLHQANDVAFLIGKRIIADARKGWRNDSAIRAFKIFVSTSASDKLSIVFHELFIGVLPAKRCIKRQHFFS